MYTGDTTGVQQMNCSTPANVPIGDRIPFAAGCATTSATLPSAGFLYTDYLDGACTQPYKLNGYIPGVCDQVTVGGDYSKFDSCASGNSYYAYTYGSSSTCQGSGTYTKVATLQGPTCSPNGDGSQTWECLGPVGSDTKTCFAGTELVTLQSGATLPMSEVKVGDRILSGNALGETSFSSVISVPHGANDLPATFLHLQLANGMDLKLTAEHLLVGGSCDDAAFTLTTAASLHVGHCVRTVSGQEKISAIQEVQGKGVYTVVTEEELIVVNGVLASPFAVNHAVPNAFYLIHRTLFWMAPALVKSAVFAEAHRVFSELFMNASM